jgi:hypothetical protein
MHDPLSVNGGKEMRQSLRPHAATFGRNTMAAIAGCKAVRCEWQVEGNAI